MDGFRPCVGKMRRNYFISAKLIVLGTGLANVYICFAILTSQNLKTWIICKLWRQSEYLLTSLQWWSYLMKPSRWKDTWTKAGFVGKVCTCGCCRWLGRVNMSESLQTNMATDFNARFPISAHQKYKVLQTAGSAVLYGNTYPTDSQVAHLVASYRRFWLSFIVTK